jgi:tetratricopeptide (TPR) repeat protein
MKRNCTLSRVLAVAACVCGATVAAPADLWFEQANRFYEQMAYDSAACYYEKIVESGTSSSAVHYNLGNAYFRQDKIGLAMLHYEKALRLAPNDEDIKANISFAGLNIVDRVPEPERTFLDALLFRLHTLFSLHTQLWMLFGALLVLSLLFSAALFASHNVRLWLVYLSSLLILLTATLGVSVGVKIHHEENMSYAIVLATSVDARNQPEGNTVLFTAHEGTKFRVRRTVDEWCLVSLPNGTSGWVEYEALGKI